MKKMGTIIVVYLFTVCVFSVHAEESVLDKAGDSLATMGK